jgi:SNF2 family DNA or RNA helicase
VYSWGLDKGAEERIHNKIGDICMSMKSADYLNLPGRISNIIKIKLPPDIQAKYDDFEKEQVLSLVEDLEEGKGIPAANAAVLSNKLLQFANGAVYDENKKPHSVHDLKIEATKEIIEDANGKPVLIAWTYRHDVERLKVALKRYNPRELKVDADIKDWNTGSIQVLMMHPASGGHGLNLQSGGHTIIWFGQTWSLELEQQLNARLDRQGQRNVVVINKLVASKTMDQDVIRAQRIKSAEQDGLMEAVKAKIKKYEKQKKTSIKSV